MGPCRRTIADPSTTAATRGPALLSAHMIASGWTTYLGPRSKNLSIRVNWAASSRLTRQETRFSSCPGGGRRVTEQPRVHRWSHCEVLEILRAWGNDPKKRGDGRWSSGHEPTHSSFSGTCLSVDADANTWWCSSCEQGGGPLALVVSILDSRTEARRWLAGNFGEPLGQQRRNKRSNHTWSTVVSS